MPESCLNLRADIVAKTSHALDLIEEINVKEDSVRDKKLSMDVSRTLISAMEGV